jgi:mono/diheme cytochrome c family protein
MESSRIFVRASAAIAVALVTACAATPRGATETNFARAKSGAPNGATAFTRECASCHGARGESGGNIPQILGEGALPEYPRARDLNASPTAGDPESLKLEAQSRPPGAPWRDPFRNARDLHNYVSKHMPLPKERAGSLSPEDYWAIINFMLLAHGVQLPPEGVTAENAAQVKL